MTYRPGRTKPVVEPRESRFMGEEITVLSHVWDGEVSAFGIRDTLERKRIALGTPVLIRLTNTSINPAADVTSTEFLLSGVPFRVTAIDGTPLNGPTELRDTRMELANGGRHDISFTMPDGPVRLTDLNAPDAGMLLEPEDGGPVAALPEDTPAFDPLTYGSPAQPRFSAFDRRFKLVLDDGLRFHNGEFGLLPLINGTQFPDTPTLMVRENEVIHTTLVNRSHEVHPMHLHGHHALVLSRNGVRQPRVRGGRTHSTSGRVRPSRSPSSRTTRASGWTTATTSNTLATAW